MLLTPENYQSGFLVDDEVIAGVTRLAPDQSDASGRAPVFAAYVSHHLTGETYFYEEFDELAPALRSLATIERPWVFEAVGCAKTAAKSCGSGGCKSCG